MDDPHLDPNWGHRSEREALEEIVAQLFVLWLQGQEQIAVSQATNTLLQETNDLLTKILTSEQPSPATHLVLTITTQGDNMPVATDVIVDTDGSAKVVASWLDALDQAAAAPANAAALVYGSDNPAVATVDPASGDVTPVSVGSFNGTVAAPLDTSGNPLLEADGVTPFPAPAPAPASIVAGPAASLVVQVEG